MATELGFEKIPVPATAEILGYLAPGSALIAIVYVAEGIAVSHRELHFTTPLHSAIKFLGVDARAAQEDWTSGLLIILGLALAAYTLGQVLDAIANLVIDRILIAKGYGFPHRQLLKIRVREERASSNPQASPPLRVIAGESSPIGPEIIQAERSVSAALSTSYFRGIFFWLNLYLAIRWFSLYKAANHGFDDLTTYLIRFSSLLGWWFIGITGAGILAGPAIQEQFKDRLDPPKPADRGFLVSLLMATANGFYDAGSDVIERILQTRRAFSEEFRDQYAQLFKKCFGLEATSEGSNNFWLPYAYVIEHSLTHGALLSRYRQLYHFSRNLGVTLWLGFIYLMMWYQSNLPGFIPHSHASASKLLLLCPLILALSCILLIHYYHLYVAYYSKFLYRSFLTLSRAGESA